MDIVIKGPGEAVICFIDSTGRTLMQERLRCAGSATVGALRGGRVKLAPVLVASGERQAVTFDGEAPSAFTRRRCRKIGCPDAVIEAATRGEAKLLREDPAHLSGRRLSPP